jgi:hypothetical protein
MPRIIHPLARLLVIALLAAGLAGCNLAGDPPTRTPSPTPPPSQTPIPQPPTETPLPPTPTPPPTATPAFAIAPFDPAPDPARPRRLASGPDSALYAAPGSAGAVFFAANPTDANSYAVIDAFGTLTVFRAGGRFGLPAPFTPFGASSRETNDKLVTAAAWSADGQSIAVLLDNPARRDANEGVWIWNFSTGIYQVLRNCRAGTPNCGNFVTAQGDPAHWYATSAEWSPDGQRLIVRAMMEDAQREGFMLVTRETNPNFRPAFCPYEYSSWTLDGARVVVSGRDGAGRQTFGTVIPETCGDYIPAPASAQNMYLFYGTQAIDGRLVAIGRKGTAFGAMYLYDQDGNQLTPEIGTARPEVVQWNVTRSAAWVRITNGRSFVVEVTGSLSEVTSADAVTPFSWGR